MFKTYQTTKERKKPAVTSNNYSNYIRIWDYMEKFKEVGISTSDRISFLNPQNPSNGPMQTLPLLNTKINYLQTIIRYPQYLEKRR